MYPSPPYSIAELSNEDLYHLMLWTPYEKRHYDGLSSELCNSGLKEKLQGLEGSFARCYYEHEQHYNELHARLINMRSFPTIITAFAGTGKSTFLHMSMRRIAGELKSEQVIADYHVFDLLLAGNIVADNNWKDWIAGRENRDEHGRLMSRKDPSLFIGVYVLLYDQIHSLLMAYNQKSESCQRLKRIVANCTQFLSDRGTNWAFEGIFATIYKLLNAGIDYSLEQIPLGDPRAFDGRDVYKSLITHDVFSCCTNEGSKDISHTDVVTNLLRLLCVLTLMSQEETVLRDKKPYVAMMAFDNIEHFIDQNAVYDEHVHDFDDCVLKFVASANASATNWEFKRIWPSESHPFSKCFKVILSIREMTKYYNKSLDHMEAEDEPLEISRAFDIRDILERKFAFYYENEILANSAQNRNISNTLLRVLDDDRAAQSNNALWTSISAMYSNNKRRIVWNILRALIHRKDCLEQYSYLWDKGLSDPYPSIYNNGARQMISRMLFDSLAGNFPNKKSGKPFDHFEELDAKNGSGLARRIVTVLGRYAYGEMVPLDELMYDLFVPHSSSEGLSVVTDPNIKSLAKILLIMRVRTMSDNWVPLVLLKFRRDVDIKVEDFEQVLTMIRDRSLTNTGEYSDYGVRVTMGGRYFADFSDSFEYFAARYCPKDLPLFHKDNIGEKGLNLIQKVCSNALICIGKTLEREKKFVEIGGGVVHYNSLYSGDHFVRKQLFREFNYTTRKHPDNAGELTHPERIIVNHIGYIDRFRRYMILEKLKDKPDWLAATDWNISGCWQKKEGVYKLADEKLKSTLVRLPGEENKQIGKLCAQILEVIGSYIYEFEKLCYLQYPNNVSANEFYIDGPNRHDCTIPSRYSDLRNCFEHAKNHPLNPELSLFSEQ